jgi:hypothetical protein
MPIDHFHVTISTVSRQVCLTFQKAHTQKFGQPQPEFQQWDDGKQFTCLVTVYWTPEPFGTTFMKFDDQDQARRFAAKMAVVELRSQGFDVDGQQRHVNVKHMATRRGARRSPFQAVPSFEFDRPQSSGQSATVTTAKEPLDLLTRPRRAPLFQFHESTPTIQSSSDGGQNWAREVASACLLTLSLLWK